jgi:hypothetical protein
MKKKQEEEKTAKQLDPANVKKERRYFSDDGKPYSFNDPK